MNFGDNKMENVKMFLFARWITTCYADEHVDDKMVSQHEKEYNQWDAMSVLNRETGHWWKKQLEYFNKVVYKNYIKNKTVEDTEKFLKESTLAA